MAKKIDQRGPARNLSDLVPPPSTTSVDWFVLLLTRSFKLVLTRSAVLALRLRSGVILDRVF